MNLEHENDWASSMCREVGLGLMHATMPLARTVVGLPLAAVTFVSGWALQFIASPPENSWLVGETSECDEATAELLG